MVNRGEGTGVVVSERGGVERASGERRQEGESPGGLFSRTRRCCCDRSLGTKRRVERQLPNLHPSGDSVHLNPCVLPLGIKNIHYVGNIVTAKIKRENMVLNSISLTNQLSYFSIFFQPLLVCSRVLYT